MYEELSNVRCFNRRRNICFQPTGIILREHYNISITIIIRGQWAYNIHGNSIKRPLYWDWKEWCFMMVAKVLSHGTVNACTAPMFSVFIHSMPVKPLKNLFVRFHMTEMPSSWIIMTRDQNIMTKGTKDDNLRT